MSGRLRKNSNVKIVAGGGGRDGARKLKPKATATSREKKWLMRVRAKQTKLSIVVERPHANAKKEKLRQPARRKAKKKRAASHGMTERSM